jgi:hypothetical protein
MPASKPSGRIVNQFLLATSCLVVVIALGCQRTSPTFESRPTVPAEGQVIVQGKPAEGVQVFLHPHDGTQGGKPRGLTDGQGRFHLRTYHDGDGAPPGEYTVTLYWPGPYNPKMAVEDQMPPDRLGERFMDRKKSALRATVGSGPTVLPPFDVK